MPRDVPSSGHLEPRTGAARVLRTGTRGAVAGTAPIAAARGTATPGDVARRMRRCLEVSLAALSDARGTPDDVIRTRVVLADSGRRTGPAPVHGEVFAALRPVPTDGAVFAFVDPGRLVGTGIDTVISEEKSP